MPYLLKQQSIFWNLALLTYYSSVTGLSFLKLMMRRNATMLIIMSLALSYQSHGGCEPRFRETKASISKAPCGVFFVLSLCPLYTVCSSDNQVPHCLPSCPWSFFICVPLDCHTSLHYQFSRWATNVLVGNFAWCNNEEILSGWAVFVLVVSWNPSMLLYMETKQRLQSGFCVLS